MRHSIRYLSAACCGVSLALSAPVLATNGDQRIGMNATQAGMGGAVLAAPEDAAILLLNPAGISMLEMDNMRLDMGFSLLNPPRSVNGVESDSNWNILPTGGVALKVNDKLYFGMAMSGIAGFGMDVSDALPPLPGNQAIITQREMFQFSPGFAYRVNDQLSLGASFNIYNQSMAMSTPQFSLPQNRQFGFGATIGAIYKVSPALQLGFSYISEKDVADHEYNTAAGKVSLAIDGPAILGFGAAFTPMPGLTVEADVKQIFFSDIRDKVSVTSPAGSGFPPQLNFGWEDSTVFALGVRKALSDNMTVRLGYNYGKSPIAADDVNNNMGAPAIVEQHLSLGFTRKFGARIATNFSYTHGFENELKSAQGNSLKVKQNWLHFQFSYAF